MVAGGALQGLRVVDLSDASGRLAGKLLAEAGAEVVRLRPQESGPPMTGPAAARGGLLDWWYDGGVRRAVVDLDTETGQRAFQDLAGRADLLIETEPPARLAELHLDYPDLERLNPRLVHASLTPFGRGGPRAGWQVSDLVAACRTARDAMHRLQAAGVPAGMVQHARHMTDTDGQLAERGWLTYLDHPIRGHHPADQYPARLSRTPLNLRNPAPTFGEHTFEVYRGLLGMSDEEIALAVGEGLFC